MPKLWSVTEDRGVNVTRRPDVLILNISILAGFDHLLPAVVIVLDRAGRAAAKTAEIWIRRPVPSYSYFSTGAPLASSTSASRSQGS